jgi:hypothetical protein
MITVTPEEIKAFEWSAGESMCDLWAENMATINGFAWAHPKLVQFQPLIQDAFTAESYTNLANIFTEEDEYDNCFIVYAELINTIPIYNKRWTELLIEHNRSEEAVVEILNSELMKDYP